MKLLIVLYLICLESSEYVVIPCSMKHYTYVIDDFIIPKEHIFNPADNYVHKSSHDCEAYDSNRPVGTKVDCLYGKVSPRRGQVYKRE
jgi:hypothetical protein